LQGPSKEGKPVRGLLYKGEPVKGHSEWKRAYLTLFRGRIIHVRGLSMFGKSSEAF
jgi:hypothetical protein